MGIARIFIKIDFPQVKTVENLKKKFTYTVLTGIQPDESCMMIHVMIQ